MNYFTFAKWLLQVVAVLLARTLYRGSLLSSGCCNMQFSFCQGGCAFPFVKAALLEEADTFLPFGKVLALPFAKAFLFVPFDKGFLLEEAAAFLPFVKVFFSKPFFTLIVFFGAIANLF